MVNHKFVTTWLAAAVALGAQNLDAIRNQAVIGAEFFANRSETKASIARHFRMMKEYGFSVARVFIIWDDIERQPGAWDFHLYDWIYDSAAESGIHIAATLCAEDPPGWMALTPFYHHRMNLNEPRLRERSSEYITQVVTRYRTHPAQGVWLLMNEPSLAVNYEPSTMRRFGEWLKVKYGSIDELNRHWFRPFESFASVQVRPEQWTSGWADYRSYIDWKEFNIANLSDHLEWIGAQVRRLDPDHPTHINPSGLVGDLPGSAQDLWRESRAVSFLGASIHPPWHFPDFAREDFGVPFAWCVDLLRSASNGRPWWVTELQGGPTIFTGGRSMNPTRAEIARWLWDAFGAGARGVVFWLWNPRTLGNEGGEWGLVTLDGRPTERLLAARAVAEKLDAMPELISATPSPARAAILYNREALLLNEIDGRTQARSGKAREALLSLVGCYRALHADHIPVDFIDIEDLKRGNARRYAVLYAPYSYAIDDTAVAALRSYVKGGGTLWADGLIGWKNEYGEMRTELPGAMTDLFGVSAADIAPVSLPYSLTAADERGGELWRLPLTLKGAGVVLRNSDGSPAATRRAFGKGQAIYYAPAVTLAYMKRRHPAVKRWITAPAREHGTGDPVAVENDCDDVGIRILAAPSRSFVILTNWGSDQTVRLAFRRGFSEVRDALSDWSERIAPSGAAPITVPVAKEGVRVLVAR